MNRKRHSSAQDLGEGRDERVRRGLDVREERGGGILVLLADGEVKSLELLVESLGFLGVRTLQFNEVVNVEAEGTDLAAKLVGRLGPVLLAHVLTNILVDASLHSK